MSKKTLEELEAERFKWSLEKFPDTTVGAGLVKAMDEIQEVILAVREKASKDELSEEYVDAIMCLLDSAARAGIYIGDIRDAYEKKLAKNKARTWKKNDDNTYSHVKEAING